MKQFDEDQAYEQWRQAQIERDWDTRPKVWKRNTDVANVKVTSAAKEKYMAAIGPEWVSSTKIADRLGTTIAAISKQLTKYEAKGFIERRPVGGRPFNNRTDYEWRVK